MQREKTLYEKVEEFLQTQRFYQIPQIIKLKENATQPIRLGDRKEG